MNIFVLDFCPDRSAKFLCDAHVVKMILESAQLLSTHDELHGRIRKFRMTHCSHPCRKALENPVNFRWLCSHLRALLEEYSFRFGKIHAVRDLFLEYWNHCENVYLPEEESLLTLPRCMPECLSSDLPGFAGTVKSYRDYYVFKMKTLPRFHYTGRAFPEWLEPFRRNLISPI